MDETAVTKALAIATNDFALMLINAISGVQAANSGNVEAKKDMPENHKRLALAMFTWSLALVDVMKAPKIEVARTPMPGPMN